MHAYLQPPCCYRCWLPMGFGLVGLAQEDKRALAHCEQRGGSVAECRLIVLGR
jgi:hypothetical protein